MGKSSKSSDQIGELFDQLNKTESANERLRLHYLALAKEAEDESVKTNFLELAARVKRDQEELIQAISQLQDTMKRIAPKDSSTD